MKIISFLNEKGGTGKTTTCVNIATALHRDGHKVIIFDCDQQGTARDWRNTSPDGADLPPVMGIDRHQLLESALAAVDADYVIIDGPAKAESMSAAIVRVSNLALIVIQPSGPDVWASGAAVKLIVSRRMLGAQIDAAFLVNRASESTKLSKEIKSGEWNQYEGIDQLDAAIGNRSAFARSMTDGISVLDMADSKAKSEIAFVIDELKAAKWL